MKTITMNRFHRMLMIVTLTVAAAGSINAAVAQEAELTLLGYRWGKTTVSYWIDSRDTSQAAVNDVAVAISDWRTALSALGADGLNLPTLEPAGNPRKADIVLHLKVNAPFHGRNSAAGDGFVIRSKTDGCVMVKVDVYMQNSYLAADVGSARTRNLARHLIGHAVGLGDVTCSSGSSPCTADLMDTGHVWSEIPDTDIGISDCDLLGIAVVYDPNFSCGQILTSIPYTCE